MLDGIAFVYLASSEGNAFVQTSAVLKRGAGFLTLHHNPWKSKERQQDSNWDSNGEFPLSLRTVRRGTEPNAVGVRFCGRGVVMLCGRGQAPSRNLLDFPPKT